MMTPNLSLPTRVVVAGAICLAILSGMIVGHAWPLWTGRTVIMRVTPVDPRDPFRGEYVRLGTAANRLRLGASGPATPDDRRIAVRPLGSGLEEPPRGSVVYVQLEPSATGDYLPVTISAQRVADALNLRGRIRYVTNRGHLDVDYGLDAFYVQEGTGPVLEQALRDGRNVQMEVAIAASGGSRIRSLLVEGVRVGR
jgi:uncharacterized membrane-anchored protein